MKSIVKKSLGGIEYEVKQAKNPEIEQNEKGCI